LKVFSHMATGHGHGRGHGHRGHGNPDFYKKVVKIWIFIKKLSKSWFCRFYKKSTKSACFGKVKKGPPRVRHIWRFRQKHPFLRVPQRPIFENRHFHECQPMFSSKSRFWQLFVILTCQNGIFRPKRGLHSPKKGPFLDEKKGQKREQNAWKKGHFLSKSSFCRFSWPEWRFWWLWPCQSCHFVNLKSCHFVNLKSCHFENLKSCHFKKLKFYKKIILKKFYKKIL